MAWRAIVHQPHRQVVGRRAFGHHSRGEDKNLTAPANLQLLKFLALEHDQLQRLGQAQVRVLPMGQVRAHDRRFP